MKQFILYVAVLTIAVWAGLDLARAAEGQTEKVLLEISADGALEWRRDAHQYVARGAVVAKQGDMTLTADELVADYRDAAQKAADGSSAPEIYRLTAMGAVTIKTATENATGSKAIYNKDDDTAILEGPVTITRGKNILTGARAHVNLKTGQSTLLGGGKGSKTRVTGVFYTSSPAQ